VTGPGVVAAATAALVLALAWARRPTTPSVEVPRNAARLAVAGVLAVGSMMTAPAATPAIVGHVWAVPRVRRQRAERRRRLAIAAELPYAVDLLGLAVGAGLTVRRAVAAVGTWGSGMVAAALHAVEQDVAAGARLADRLESLPSALGDDVRPLVAGLVACERFGAPVADTLARLALEARAAERRRREAEIRRLPVRMVFPLVVCVLPAFALLTVAPLVAGSLTALER
jgi:tight adherence protein C